MRFQKFQQNQITMIRNLTHVGLALAILSEVIFTGYAPEKSTNWSIFYYSLMYTGFAIISIKEMYYSISGFDKSLSFICMLFFVSMTINMLAKINMNYDLFMISVNNSLIDKVRYLSLGLIGGLISAKYLIRWGKHLQKLGK